MDADGGATPDKATPAVPAADGGGGSRELARLSSTDFTLTSITLRTLPHLRDYLPDLPTLRNPIDGSRFYRPCPGFYIGPSDVVLRHIIFDLSGDYPPSPTRRLLAYHRAGPREAICFDPEAVRAAVVTCGGLCPGLNTVIRELVVGLWELYGVRQIHGIRDGYRGFYSSEPLRLEPRMVHNWHKRGGTALATSRGGFDLDRIVGAIETRGFNQEVKFQSILKIVDKRWQDQMHSPLHLAGFFLNPSLYFKVREKDVSSCGKFESGFFTCLERMVPDLDLQDKIGDQVTIYLNERGMFGRELAARARDRRMSIEWWVTYGGETSKLKNIAIRILGLCCSTFGCERNWSTFEFVYIIGGDGTMRGAVKIFEEISRRRLNVSVVGIPKTVDNDIGIIDRSFGFQTAVEMAQQAINAAHVEAESAVNGIGLVKLMGRSTGHIALYATLSSRDVDCCLIPENDFYLEGKGGLFEFLDQRLKQNGHAVLVVAEGAGQDLIPRTTAAAAAGAALKEEERERDPSGNPVFLDVGPWLKSELRGWWEREHPGELFTVKYIDPTYMIRAVPANATDNLYCTLLAHSAIHGVMAGYTGFVCGPINGNYAYIPVEEVAVARNAVDTQDHKWAWVRSVTNQPDFAKRD